MSPERNTERRNLKVALIVGVLLGLAGVPAARVTASNTTPKADLTQGDSGVPVSYSDAVAPGSGLSGTEAAAAVEESLASTEVQSVSVIPAPQRSVAEEPWVRVSLDSRLGDDPETIWLGALVEGAVADLMRTGQTTTNRLISGGEVLLEDKDGTPTTVDLGAGSVLGGQVFNSPDDQALTSRVDQVAKQFGLTVKLVQILHPLESAISVTFVVPDFNTVDWSVDQLRAALEGTPKSIEGTFVQLIAESGEPLLRAGAAYRTGTGSLWFADGQDLRFGAIHGNVAEPGPDNQRADR